GARTVGKEVVGLYAPAAVETLPTARPTNAKTDSGRLLRGPVTSTFFINRDCEEGRRAFIDWHLREARIDAERICAVEGLNVPGAPGIGRRPS
ncbi:MAG: hypothetical protein V3T13_07325, partial [Hyphomicrobium sp.]